MAAMLAASAAAAAAPPPRPLSRVVALATSVNRPKRPTVVLVHGLDSSKQTFERTLSALTAKGIPAVALDLRGSGESPLGDPADFSAEALASDVHGAVARLGLLDGGGKIVLVGHSMGGRVAMAFGALHYSDVAGPCRCYYYCFYF